MNKLVSNNGAGQVDPTPRAGRRLSAYVMTFMAALAITLCGVLGFNPSNAAAATGVPDDPTLSAPAREKTVTPNGDGTYKVSLNVTGAKSSDTGETVTNQPLDIVLVLDVSGSMDDNLSGSTKKIDALKTAVNNFINATAEENKKIDDQSQQNRIALVKFAGDEKTSVGNDFYYESRYSYNNTQIVSNLTYDVSGLTSTVDGLKAAGATSADYAFNRAQAALTQARPDAKKVVIFFTDGEPNHYSGFDNSVAATAVNKAKDLKDAGTTIYSIGVVSGANPSDTTSNLNKYMHGISSNYPDATAVNWRGQASWNNLNLGSRADNSSYYKAATDADELNSIFESIRQEITKTAEYADVTIHDKLSSWVVGTTSADGKPSDFTYEKTKDGQTTTWTDAPQATVAADGTVSWPVTSNGGKLEDGVTYTVSFNVKPTQAAFDEAVKNHKDDASASGDNNFYTNDNPSATVDYKTVVTSSQGGTTTSDPQNAAYPQKPTITLPVSKVTVTKTWADGNENHSGDSVTVQLKQDGKDYGDPVTLNADGKWSHDFTVPAGPDGHKYTVEETKVDGYDTTYDLAVTKEDTSKVVTEDGAQKLSLVGLVEQAATVTVTNKPSTGGVSLTKVVEAKDGFKVPADGTFEFTVSIKDKDGQSIKNAKLEGYNSMGEVSDDDKLTLTNGQTVTVSGLPADATVTFTETVPTEYTASDNGSVNAKVEVGKTKDLTVTNTYKGYGLKIYKTDENKKPLAGAQFTIKKDDGKASDAVTTGNDGYAKLLDSLPDGTYTISETYVPSGYQKHDDLTIVVSDNGKTVTLGGEAVALDSDGYYKISVQNTKAATNLPQTGGMGNGPLFVGGMAIIAGAVAYAVKLRKN